MSLLASLRPSATTETNLYNPAAGKKAVVNITINNCNGTDQAKIRLGIQAASGALAAKDYILYDYTISPNGPPIQLTGIALTALNNVRVYTDVATVNFHVNGIEENV